MPPSNAETARRWFDEVWNRKNRSAIREMMSPDCVNHGLGIHSGGPVVGREGFEQFFDTFVKVFPDLHVEIQDVISESDKIAMRFLVTGTQKGDLPGQAATGKKVRFTGGGICRFEDGKFAEVWNQVDFFKMSYDLAPDTPDVE